MNVLRLTFVLLLGLPSLTYATLPLRVVALNSVLAEIAKEVGGYRVVVTNLVPPGVDPHTFDPSAADMREMEDASLLLASGLQLETYLDRAVTKIVPQGEVLFVGDALPSALSLAGGEKDPHWWHSVENMIFATQLVLTKYVSMNPQWAEEYAHNAQAYTQRLLALKTWVMEELAPLPPSRRQLVTSHDAFGYFARDYGFAVHAIAGLSPDAEADAQHLARVIDLIRREHIHAVFAESSVNSALVANLVAETGVRLGGSLYADGLGATDSDGATYEAMYRHNVRTIVEALR